MQKSYICELCKSSYKNRNDALKCENFHAKPLEIANEYYLSPLNKGFYPISVVIKMSDGTEQVYQRNW